ncbi:hypothetical protein JTF08_05985 [Micrococcaceae bacterium RIT802]|nr:hypothetical protein [Micrococcaceae bacterium RIT 802]
MSRDTLAFLDETWTLREYIARQSPISGMSPPTEVPCDLTLKSDFQRRCVEGDFQSDSRVAMEERPVQVVLLDMVDDRIGVFQTGEHRYVTHSWELTESGILPLFRDMWRRVDFGTDEHFDLWSAAMRQFAHIIRESGSVPIFLAPAWAETFEDGSKVPPYRGQEISQINDDLNRYFNVASEAGYAVVRPHPNRSVASLNHQWGRAPYHFANSTYETLREGIYTAWQSHSKLER